MLEHEQTLATVLRTVTDDVRTRPTFAADVRRGALRRRRRNRILGGTTVAVGAALVVSALAAQGLRPVAGPENTAGTDAAGGSASASAPATGPVPVDCRVERLPVPAGHPRSLVTGGDPSGRFLVGRAYASTGYVDKHPLLIWDGDSLTRVDMPGADERFVDINGSGVAVGSSFGAEDRSSAYVYRDGRLDPLQPPAGSGGTGVEATAVGENGTIAGVVGDGVDSRSRPVVWRDRGAVAQPLTLPDGFRSGRVGDVDTDGTIVGTVTRDGPPGQGEVDRGYVWKADGTGRLLPLPLVDGAPVRSWSPTTVHDGVVYGIAVTGGSAMTKSHPLLFDLRTERFTMLTHAFGLVGNRMGWLVQEGDRISVAGPAGRVGLPPLVSGVAPEERAAFISADGLVLGGQSNDASGQFQAVRWRCRTGTA